MAPITLRLPSTSSLSDAFWEYRFDPNEAPHLWMAFKPTGGKQVKCSTRKENQELFTGVYYAHLSHNSAPCVAGVGEQTKRGKQTGMCLIVIADTPDNFPLIAAIERNDEKRVQVAVVDEQAGMGTSTGWAAEGQNLNYDRVHGCFYVRFQVFARCSGYIAIKNTPNKSPTKAGNLLAGAYDYDNTSEKSDELTDLRKFLDASMKVIKPKNS